MLSVIDIQGKKLESLDECAPEFYIYDLGARDYFPYFIFTWYEQKHLVYTIDIDGELVDVPETFHIVIGDIHGEIDCITPAELIGRDFDVLTFHTEFLAESWQLLPMKVVNVEERTMKIPKIPKATEGVPPTAVPVAISNKKAIMVSEADIYPYLKDLCFADIA